MRPRLRLPDLKERQLHSELHPLTPHHLPFYIAKPGETDWLMIVMGIFLIGALLAVGNIYLRLHTLPERMAHKSQKLQFEIVAVLGLLASLPTSTCSRSRPSCSLWSTF